MNISELNGVKLKKALGDKFRAVKSYHNKNKRGGNFGFVIVWNPQPEPRSIEEMREKFRKEIWFMLNGMYDTNGEIIELAFGRYAEAGTFINADTFEDLITQIKEIINREIVKRVDEELSNSG